MNITTEWFNIILFIFVLIEGCIIFFLQKNLKDNTKNFLTNQKISEELIRENLENKYEKIIINLEKKIQDKEEKYSNRLILLQENISKKEDLIVEKINHLELKQNLIKDKEYDLNKKREEFEIEKQLFINKFETGKLKLKSELEKVAKITTKEAQEKITKLAKQEIKNDLFEWQNKFLFNVKDEANYKASEIVSLAIQRCSSEVTNEQTVTNIKLQSDSEKGKIIGKNGRNLIWLEKTLGVEFIIDDNNDSIITISGFSSLRRHIAKKTVEKLLEDGRVHPASIEEMYEKSKAEIASEIAIAGEEACNEVGIYDFNAKLIRILGRLKFRTSYGQNMLKHAVEMAKLAKNLAIELNKTFPNKNPIDIDICIKGALLHDIGKAIDEETLPKGNHIDLGEKICEMFDLDWRIKKCITSHHNESYYDGEKGFCIEAVLVDACDNISGGRPGARKDSVEAYYQRMTGLEEIANKVEGVSKSWIMRGSRELWIFFDANKVSSEIMRNSVRDVTTSIQETIRYPGEIKVIGFWEDRVVEYAR
jgi:ribonucrease Y